MHANVVGSSTTTTTPGGGAANGSIVNGNTKTDGASGTTVTVNGNGTSLRSGSRTGSTVTLSKHFSLSFNNSVGSEKESERSLSRGERSGSTGSDLSKTVRRAHTWDYILRLGFRGSVSEVVLTSPGQGMRDLHEAVVQHSSECSMASK